MKVFPTILPLFLVLAACDGANPIAPADTPPPPVAQEIETPIAPTAPLPLTAGSVKLKVEPGLNNTITPRGLPAGIEVRSKGGEKAPLFVDGPAEACVEVDIVVTEHFTGKVTFDIESTTEGPDESSDIVTEIKRVTLCNTADPSMPVTLTSQTIGVSIGDAEDVCVLPPGFAALVAGVPGHPVAAVGGADAVAFVDLVDGVELGTVPMPKTNVLAAVTNESGETHALFSGGPDGLDVKIWNNDDGSDFIDAETLIDGENITDISVVGNAGSSDELIAVSNGGNYFVRVCWNETGGEYELDVQIDASAFPESDFPIVSAHAGEPGGPVLAFTEGGDTYQVDDGGVTRLAETGPGAGRIRICGNDAFLATFGDGSGLGFGAVQYYQRAAGDFALSIGRSVSGGALGLSCLRRPDGSIDLVVPSSGVPRVLFQSIDPDGNFVADEILDTPGAAGAFAAWVQRDAFVRPGDGVLILVVLNEEEE